MRLAAAVLIALAATSAHAQRLDTLSMSCGQARATVARSGAVVLHSGPNIYDRYVASPNFCAFGETTRPAYVSTRDAAACFLGSTCVTPDQRRLLFSD